MRELLISDYHGVPNMERCDEVTMGRHALNVGGPEHAIANWGNKLRAVADGSLWYASEAKSLLDEIVVKLVRRVEIDRDNDRMFGGKMRKPRPSELYRAYSGSLRLAGTLKSTFSWRALDLLQTFQLQSSLSWADLESNPGFCAYTGEQDVDELDFQDILPEQHEIVGDPWTFMFEKANQLAEWETEKAPMVEMVKQPGSWNRYAQERMPYADPALNELFYQANAEGVGDLFDPMDFIEDVYDENIPMHMIIAEELNISADANQVVGEIKGFLSDAYQVVSDAFKVHDKSDKRFWRSFWPALKGQLLSDVGNSIKNAASYCTDHELATMILATEGRFGLPAVTEEMYDQVQNDPMVVNWGWVPTKVAAAYIFDRADLWGKVLNIGEGLENKQNYLKVCSSVLDFTHNPTQGIRLSKDEKKAYTKASKMIWRVITRCHEVDNIIANFGDEIADGLNETGNPFTVATENEDIQRLGNQYLREILNMSPEYAPKRNDTRLFQEGFIRGVLEGLPISNAPYTCNDNAHDYWREEISPAGYVAYRRGIKAGWTNSQSMNAFWRAARLAGDVQDQILRVEPHGLIVRAKSKKLDQIAEPRLINYGLAAFIAKKGEIDLSGNKPARLLDILRERGWGLKLQSALS